VEMYSSERFRAWVSAARRIDISSEEGWLPSVEEPSPRRGRVSRTRFVSARSAGVEAPSLVRTGRTTPPGASAGGPTVDPLPGVAPAASVGAPVVGPPAGVPSLSRRTARRWLGLPGGCGNPGLGGTPRLTPPGT